MAQVKIYGQHAFLKNHRSQISDLIQEVLQLALGLPADKRFQRFLMLEPEDFIYPPDRSQQYLILEIHLFSGRSAQTLENLLRALQTRLVTGLGLHINDLEITLIETPPQHWAIRGQLGHELALNYNVNK